MNNNNNNKFESASAVCAALRARGFHYNHNLRSWRHAVEAPVVWRRQPGSVAGTFMYVIVPADDAALIKGLLNQIVR